MASTSRGFLDCLHADVPMFLNDSGMSQEELNGSFWRSLVASRHWPTGRCSS
jgi:hypothetical protein